jgi:adenylate kinase
MSKRIPAILLVGPTGSGKTPLGEYLESHGFGARRCVHFDFGAQLRLVGAGDRRIASLTDADVMVAQKSLESSALLEDKHFAIAAKILKAFAKSQSLGQEDVIVLNGLPRHEGQARDMESIVSMEAVISLQCSAKVVRERIQLNGGGDRTGREDDSIEAIGRKLELFSRRTMPLIEFYRSRGVSLYSLIIGADTSPVQAWQQLAGMNPAASRQVGQLAW